MAKRNQENGSSGPLTAKLLGGRDCEGPPPILKEWGEYWNKKPGDTVVLWAGLTRFAPKNGWSWCWLSTHVDEGASEKLLQVDADTAAKVERLLSPLAHESRFMILQALQREPLSATDLSVATGLKGGNLYHHLRDLLGSAYVLEKDPGYALSDLGRQLVVTLSQIAKAVVQDRNSDGLVVGTSFES